MHAAFSAIKIAACHLIIALTICALEWQLTYCGIRAHRSVLNIAHYPRGIFACLHAMKEQLRADFFIPCMEILVLWWRFEASCKYYEDNFIHYGLGSLSKVVIKSNLG
jgi:hypothetical protein